jgi:DNA modification methylase
MADAVSGLQSEVELWFSHVDEHKIFDLSRDAKIIRKGKDIFMDTPGTMIEPDEGYINHPTPKPKTFIKELMLMFSKEGDIVLDPFAGSGTSLVAAETLDRRWVGIELSPNYSEIANNRVKPFVEGKRQQVIEF